MTQDTLGRIEHDGGPCPLPEGTLVEAFGAAGGRHIGRIGQISVNWSRMVGYRVLVPAAHLAPLIEEVKATRNCIVECSTVRGDLATMHEADAREVRRLDDILATACAAIGRKESHA